MNFHSLLAVFLVASLSATAQTHAAASSSSRSALKLASSEVAASYGKLPLSFEVNQGQAGQRVNFLAHGADYSLYLTDSAAVLTLTGRDLTKKRFPVDRGSPGRPTKTDVVRMELTGASTGSRVKGVEELPGKVNCFLGEDRKKWRTDIPTYGKVRYTGVYPGIDLLYYGNQGQLEYDFVVAPGGDPKSVRLRFSGVAKLSLKRNGDLLVVTKNGEVAFHKPVVYQESGARRTPVAGSFSLLAKDTIGFTLGSYDHNQTLVIDPTLAYSTYLGGYAGGTYNAPGIAVDAFGHVFVTGGTYHDFPVTGGAFQTNFQGEESGKSAVFVTKMNAGGSALVYSTYLSVPEGTQTFGTDIAVDPSGNAYIVGVTDSKHFPITSGALQQNNPTTGNGNRCSFVSKLGPSGSALVYSTYLCGATGSSSAMAIAIDPAGDAFVTGSTGSRDFPVTAGSFQQILKGQTNAFVTKLNPAGSALVYSTYLGGTDSTSAANIALDQAGDAFVAGSTYAFDFPVTNGAFQATNHALPGHDNSNAFVTKLQSNGADLIYSTYLGGSGNPHFNNYGDSAYTLTVDDQGYAYVAGLTASHDFPVTSNAYQQTNLTNPKKPAGNGFVTKLNPTGTDLAYSTYLGGSTFSYVTGIGLAGSGRVFVVGTTSDTDFPTTGNAFQIINRSSSFGDGFLTELNRDGSYPLYSTYLGGSGYDSTGGVAVDRLGNVYLSGVSLSTDFPIAPGAYQEGNASVTNHPVAVVAKFAFHGATTTHVGSNIVALPGTPVDIGISVTPVNPQGNIPTGQAALLIDRQIVALLPLDAMGNAFYTTDTLSLGLHTVVASYSGDSTYSSSTGKLIQQIGYGQAAQPVFSPLSGTYNRVVVSIRTPTNDATIHYTIDGKTPTESSTVYTIPVSIRTSQILKAIAMWRGTKRSALQVARYTIVPNAITTTTTLKSSSFNSISGHPLTLTATVDAPPSATALSGTVAFQLSGALLATAPVVNGVATFTTSSIAPGGYRVTANYTGSSIYSGSVSSSLGLSVRQQ